MADNKPNTPDDKKTVPASKTPKKENAGPVNEPVKTDGKAPDNVVVLPVKNSEPGKAAAKEANPHGGNEKTAQEKPPVKKTAEKGGPAKEDKKPTPGLSPADEKLKREQEALLKDLDEKSGLDKKKPAPKKQAEKKPKEGRPPKGPAKEKPPAPEPEKPPEPREAPRPEQQEKVEYLNLSELFPFKDHPFQVQNDAEMAAMVESVKEKGITQPATVRPREGGGYEMVSGHRRQMASQLAGFLNMPCIVKNLTDEQAITQMVEDNTTQREHILPSEKAKALKMQLDAIKRQGARDGNGSGERSNAIVAERNHMSVKNVQRYIKLNDIVPDLMKYVDQKIDKISIGFTTAIELACIKPENQRYIVVAIEGNQSSPSPSQAQRMRELDSKGQLNPDVIDGILTEQKKEVDKVILSSQELSEYFGKDMLPRDMKDKIMELLAEWKGQQKDIAAPEKKAEKLEK